MLVWVGARRRYRRPRALGSLLVAAGVLVACRPTDRGAADELLAEGPQAYLRGDYPAAREPRSAEGTYRLGRTPQVLNLYDDDIDFHRQALELAPDDARPGTAIWPRSPGPDSYSARRVASSTRPAASPARAPGR